MTVVTEELSRSRSRWRARAYVYGTCSYLEDIRMYIEPEVDPGLRLSGL